MNKYDEPLDLSYENSLSLIVKQIKPNSVVLEFGPAMGRLTRHLKDNLNCEVYIVEIDRDAYDYTIRYAVDGVLGDIESYMWLDKFSNIKFDYIIFADVLEHLNNPSKVLFYSTKLLKNDGRILSSIPNIAYNAVLIDLYHNKFEYKNTGLLDNTHLRFFTYESLEPFFGNAGLIIEKENIVHLNLENSGFGTCYEDIDDDLRNCLLKREFADAYQFIITAVLRDYYINNKDTIKIEKTDRYGYKSITSQVYIDTGDDFNEKEKFTVQLRLDSTNQFCINLNLRDYTNIKRIRIDLCNEISFLKDIQVDYASKISVDIPGLLKDDIFYFIDEPVRIYINITELEKMDGDLTVKGIMGVPSQSVIKEIYIERIASVINENKRLEIAISEKQNEIYKSMEYIDEKNNIIKYQEKLLQSYQGLVESKDKEITNLIQKISEKDSIIIDNDNLIKQIQVEIIKLQQENDSMNELIVNYKQQLNNKDLEIQSLNNEIKHIQESFGWKVKHYIGKCIKKRKQE